MITLQEFEHLANANAAVPITETKLADLHTPVSIYLALRTPTTPSFLLESVEPDERIGRYSFIGIDPILLIKAKGRSLEIESAETKEHRTGKILDVLDEYLKRYQSDAFKTEQGFVGGFLGYYGYDRVQDHENILLQEPSEEDLLDAVFGLFTQVVKYDHFRQVLTIIQTVLLDRNHPLKRQYANAQLRLHSLMDRLDRPPQISVPFRCDFLQLAQNEDRENFCASVRRAKEYIYSGDIFQVVLSRRVQVPFSGDPFAMYRTLRTINPSPYLFYMDFQSVQLIGSSPEVLVRVQDTIVSVMPIAGTRPRGMTPEEDKQLEDELMRDEKECAEHVMLVDLGRNDIGRISICGSVRVPVFKKLKRFSHVMHLVSEVRGELKSDASVVDALRACFPAGTVSGAPKVRAMEIIAELEAERRGIYAGAVGYVGFNGTLDTCIAIRTIIAANGMLSIQTGAGIVADSVPELEYNETVNKAQALIQALSLASNGLSHSFVSGNGDGRIS